MTAENLVVQLVAEWGCTPGPTMEYMFNMVRIFEKKTYEDGFSEAREKAAKLCEDEDWSCPDCKDALMWEKAKEIRALQPGGH